VIGTIVRTASLAALAQKELARQTTAGLDEAWDNEGGHAASAPAREGPARAGAQRAALTGRGRAAAFDRILLIYNPSSPAAALMAEELRAELGVRLPEVPMGLHPTAFPGGMSWPQWTNRKPAGPWSARHHPLIGACSPVAATIPAADRDPAACSVCPASQLGRAACCRD
jgi:hypothetical protein